MASRRLVRLTVCACALAATWAVQALAGPVTGAAFTSVNPAVDGAGTCKNGSPAVNCNLYAGKAHVWLNGGPAANALGPDGDYFFAVLAPGGQPDPNDGGPQNLSDDFDAYTNRTFTVSNGEVSSYSGSHGFDSGAGAGPRPPDGLAPMIRLHPYANTPNSGGVYILAVCSLGATGTRYPVDPDKCKYDAYKVGAVDPTPPVCVLTAIGTNGAGAKYIQVTVQDSKGSAAPGSGVESIVIDHVTNANLKYSPDNWYAGILSPVVITATKVDQTRSSFLTLTVTNVAGLSTTCDPEVPATKVKRAHRPLNRRGSVR
jgi:hypothetical protein